MKILRHPNIIAQVDGQLTEQADGSVESMLLLEDMSGNRHLGELIAERSSSNSRFNEQEVLHFFHQVCMAIQYLHELKPPASYRNMRLGNIIIFPSATAATIKLVDFCACTTAVIPEHKSLHGVQIAELMAELDMVPHTYRAPEMFDLRRRRGLDIKSDIWALGVLLYKVCFFRDPFPGADKDVVAQSILHGQWSMPQDGAYSTELRMLLRQCLSDQPRLRPTIQQVLKRVDKLMMTAGRSSGDVDDVSVSSSPPQRRPSFKWTFDSPSPAMPKKAITPAPAAVQPPPTSPPAANSREQSPSPPPLPPRPFSKTVAAAPALPPSPTNALAEEKSALAKQAFERGDHARALALYSEAINLSPETAPYYISRAAIYVTSLRNFSEAVMDYRHAVDLEPGNVQWHVYAAKSYLMLGKVEQALEVLRSNDQLQQHPTIQNELSRCLNIQLLQERIQDSVLRFDWNQTLALLDEAATLATGGVDYPTRWAMSKSEALMQLNRHFEAEALLNVLAQKEPHNPRIFYSRALLYYAFGDFTRTHDSLKHALQVEPDHVESKALIKASALLERLKDEGNAKFQAGDMDAALQAYTQALAITPPSRSTSAKLYSNRASTHARLSKFNEAIEDCTLALQFDPNWVKVLVKRAEYCQKLGNYEQAIADLENALWLDMSNTEVPRRLEEVRKSLVRSHQIDYYKVLEVPVGADMGEIKRAYKALALRLHPDRNINTANRDDLERHFKLVREAFDLLSDPEKRQEYDRSRY